MNKILLYFLLFIFVSGFSSCREERIYRIGVSQCSRDDWRTKMNDEIKREAMFHADAQVEVRSADDNNEKQIADIRYFMDNDFDIIIAAPNEADAITPVISEAYQKGIPVIIFDRNINGDSYTAYLGVDNVGIGKAAAHYARHLTGQGGKVIEIHGLKGSTPASGRHEGFIEGAKEEGALTILSTAYGNWNYDDALVVADSLLAIYPETDLVYAHNDRMAIAASDAAKQRGLSPYIIGVDAAPEIGIRAVADSVITATFLYPTEGHRLVRTALAILKGEPYDTIVNLPVSSAVDISNADILLLQNESLKEETSKMQLLKSQVDDYWSKHSAQTTLFYAAIAILVLLFGFLFLLLRAFWQRKRHQKVLVEQNRLLEEQRDLQKSLNEQLNAATQSKLVFFTNVSHDLRTPLTLIAEPVEQLAGAENLTPQQHTLMKIANKNVKILRRLINQILDFRKYENGKLNLNLEECDFGALVREWAEAFYAVARKRDIKLSVDVGTDDFTIAIDQEKIERVFFNLMSNAFKYTPDNGTIIFTCRRDADMVEFAVSDTGQGISQGDIGNIFERFYQVDKVHPNGSGIGLSLARAFVELHDGEISVESELGKGSKFTVRIPVRHVAVAADETSSRNIKEADVEAELGEIEAEGISTDDDKPLVLVIDDNDDIRKMISELLCGEYRILCASNGREGIRKAAKYVPDLIICDVMMPVMDGLECCRGIKAEMSTSHIPILMLTACSMDEQRVEGYDSGADGYLAKPFSSAVLKSRCRSLILNRRRIRDLWQGTQGGTVLPSTTSKPSAPPSPAGPDVESEFYARFLEILKSEMGNPELNVDQLAAQMGLGRSQFYRKIKALTNYSPVELLRRLRLNQARELLTSTEKSISEIAYEVGFSTPAYFTRCYREAFGETPSDLRERLMSKS